MSSCPENKSQKFRAGAEVGRCCDQSFLDSSPSPGWLLPLVTRRRSIASEALAVVVHAFKDTSERDEVLATLKRTYLSKRTEGSTPLLFTILPEHFDFSINYVPTHHITCVVPNEGGPTT